MKSHRCFNFGLVILRKRKTLVSDKRTFIDFYPSLDQKAKEDVLQKEVRVKILKDNIKSIAKKVPSSGQELTSKLNVELENYQQLCKRIGGKCQALEVCYLFFSDVFLRLKFCNVLTISISWKKKHDFSPNTGS